MSEISENDKKIFKENGYHVISSLLTLDEAEKYRHKINKVFDLPEKIFTSDKISRRTYSLADGVTKNSDFWPAIFNNRLLAAVRGLLGDEIRYTQHSDLHINLGGGRYHRDSRCREFGESPDWDESSDPYKVVRVAIYLSDYKDSGSALEILPGSHKKESKINRIEYILWNKLRVYLRKKGLNEYLPHWFFTRKRIKIKTKPGDCMILDQRLMHAGSDLNNKQFPKYAIYLAFGIDNIHSINHRSFYLDRPTYSKNIPEDLRIKLKENSLLL